MLMQIPMAKQAYYSRSRQSVGQTVINMYVETNPEGSAYPYSLIGRDGLDLWVMLGSFPARCWKVFRGFLYVATSNRLYKIDTQKTVKDLGAVVVGDRASMDDNGIDLTICSTAGVYYAITNDKITKPALPSHDLFPATNPATTLPALPGTMTQQDGFIILSFAGAAPEDKVFRRSKVKDATTWDSLDLYSATERSDPIVRVFSSSNNLFILKAQTYEVFFNDPATGLFAQQGGAVRTTVGCGAAYSVIEADQRMFMLGSDGIFYAIEGYNLKRISTYGIEEEIRKMPRSDDCIVQTYTAGGHKFLIVTFPSAGRTIPYDIAEDKWFDWQSFGKKRWKANLFVDFAGVTLASDFENGNIYEVTPDTITDNAEPIPAVVETIPVAQGNNKIKINRLNLEMETGTVDRLDRNPQIAMQFSGDGGTNWSNEIVRSVGKRGQSNELIVWDDLGQSRQWMFRFITTDAFARRLTGLNAEVEVFKHG